MFAMLKTGKMERFMSDLEVSYRRSDCGKKQKKVLRKSIGLRNDYESQNIGIQTERFS